MSGWRVAAMIVGAVLTVCDAAPADNVLDGIRNEVNESSSKGDDDSSSSVGSRNSDFWDDDDDDESFSNFLLRGVLSSPFTVPVLVTGDDYDAWAAFPAAPFDRHDGYLILDSESAIERSWGGRFALDTGGNFDDVAALTGDCSWKRRVDSVSMVPGRSFMRSSGRAGTHCRWAMPT